MDMRRDWKRQGDLGEASAIEWLTRSGACVFAPVFSSPGCDLIAHWGERLERVQVKTSIAWWNGRFQVTLRTSGGNQSWNGVIKYLGPERCDRVFAHVGDGRRWYIPASALGGHGVICLGGPKYSEFEVDPGAPLPWFSSPGTRPMRGDGAGAA